MFRFPGDRFRRRAEYVAAEAREDLLPRIAWVSGRSAATSGTVFPRPFEYCVVSSVGIFRMPASANQQLRVAYQMLLLKNRRQQFLLDVDHHQRALAKGRADVVQFPRSPLPADSSC